ncbi:MAG: hypothetical protein B6244_09635 [Candidatus Cloacimonetes bacterium 4572_55]|nr:MAG: hypothetical protein B6244_09635 [Candidatus Cloacimonetes bacterium 4572_55]
MRISVLDVLNGEFKNGRQVLVGGRENRLQSIIDNLRRLFSVTQGTATYLPEFGAPDISSARLDLDALSKSIRESINKFEPRLERVKIREIKARGTHVEFILSAKIKNGNRVKFQTILDADERVDITPVKTSYR